MKTCNKYAHVRMSKSRIDVTQENPQYMNTAIRRDKNAEERRTLVCLQTLSFLSFSIFFSKVYNLVQLKMIW